VGIFAGWECCLLLGQGESHFLFHAFDRPVSLLSKLNRLSPALLTLLGGLAAPLIPFGLLGLGCGRRCAAIAVAVVVAGYLFYACVPVDAMTLVHYREGKTSLHVGHLLFGGFGLTVVAIGILAARRLVVGGKWARADLFLVAWLGCELAGFFLLTP